jgi:hypothetical protein
MLCKLLDENAESTLDPASNTRNLSRLQNTKDDLQMTLTDDRIQSRAQFRRTFTLREQCSTIPLLTVLLRMKLSGIGRVTSAEFSLPLARESLFSSITI